MNAHTNAKIEVCQICANIAEMIVLNENIEHAVKIEEQETIGKSIVSRIY
jgi:hypothetical protein